MPGPEKRMDSDAGGPNQILSPQFGLSLQWDYDVVDVVLAESLRPIGNW